MEFTQLSSPELNCVCRYNQFMVWCSGVKLLVLGLNLFSGQTRPRSSNHPSDHSWLISVAIICNAFLRPKTDLLIDEVSQSQNRTWQHIQRISLSWYGISVGFKRMHYSKVMSFSQTTRLFYAVIPVILAKCWYWRFFSKIHWQQHDFHKF